MLSEGVVRSPVGGHPRLVGCEVVNAARERSIRYIELEKYRLWVYAMYSRHNIEVHPIQLGLWVDYREFESNPEPFRHGVSIEDVTCIVISWFNPRHKYSFDVTRYVPTGESESVKDILLSHISQSEARSERFDVVQHHGVYVSKTIEEPDAELILGLSGMEMHLNGSSNQGTSG